MNNDEELAAVKADLEQLRANFGALINATSELAQGIESLAIVIAKDPGPAEGLASILVQHALTTLDYYRDVAAS